MTRIKPNKFSCRFVFIGVIRVHLGLVFCFLTVTAASQQKLERQVVEGVVVDQAGDPVASATVTLVGNSTTAATSTDNEGRFRLESTPQSPLFLEISANGFATIKQRVIQSDQANQLRVV